MIACWWPQYQPPSQRLFPSVLLIAFTLTMLWSERSRCEIDWVTGEDTAEARVQLYFFWSSSCPHCGAAHPFVEELDSELDWLELRSYELTANRDNIARYIDMAGELGQEARSVPAFFVCGQLLTGFDRPDGIGALIRQAAEQCRPDPASVEGTGGRARTPEPGLSAPETEQLSIPVMGEIDAQGMSLPLFTLVIAALDAFNPCAFFVLLFLLSLMVHARSRAHMLLVGGTFVFCSGAVYFLFMAAWLNLFLLIGGTPWVTLIAGLVALVIGVLNVKDFFILKHGPSLSIPESAKPGLFRRMRGLLSADSLTTMMIGTFLLALAANSYELLCTAGFPMVYTRVLTLRALSGWDYYAWLLLYNLIYVLPLLAMVLLFTLTLGGRKLTERQGRVLKLLSGTMMLGLGATMLVSPELLNNPWSGLGLLLVAATVTAAAVAMTRQGKP